MKKYASVIFVVLLGLVFLLSIPAVTDAFMDKWESTAGRVQMEEPLPTEEATSVPTASSAPEASADPDAPTPLATPTEAPALFPTALPTQPSAAVQFVPERGSFTTVDASYFDDALFIGDSRTDDIYKYGTLKNATYFATVGMSVYKLHNTAVNVPGAGKVYFSDFIRSRSFGKVYVMLGFNEVGYNKERTVGKMRELLGEIRAAQPNALIFVEANLYVTKHTSETDKYEHNGDIRYLNNRFSELADGETVMYIDVNPLFCDSEGNLKSEFTGDGHHVYAKYYKTWCEWLMTRGVVKAAPTAPPATDEPTEPPVTADPTETPEATPTGVGDEP